MLIDTHCHLNFPPLFADVSGVLERAATRGVSRILVPSYDLASWEDVANLAALAGVYPAYGLHPWRAEEPLDTAVLARRLIAGEAVAVGEIGLDFKTEVSRERQVQIFEAQAQVAMDLDLPVMLHVRGAFEEMLTILGRMHPRPRGVVHAFSKGSELAERFIDLGYHIAFGGAITRPNAKQARRAAATLPLECLVLETDAPSIALDGVPPEKVEPAHTADIADCLAALRGEARSHVAAVTTTNAVRLFRLERPT